MEFFRFKSILLGAAAVGKTSLLHQYVSGKFSDDYAATIGVDFLSKEVDFEESTVKITIWDLAGQPKFKFLRKNFYNGTHGALLIFDLTREGSFEELSTWYSEMMEFARDEIPFILIGNKLDLILEGTEDRVISTERAKEYAQQYDSVYMETSAKTGKNVEEAFRKLMVLMGQSKGHEIK